MSEDGRILTAVEWSSADVETLRRSYECLRRMYETSQQQIALWTPLIAWRHGVEAELARLRPVYEAAKAWRYAHGEELTTYRVDHALRAAIDAALAKERG